MALTGLYSVLLKGKYILQDKVITSVEGYIEKFFKDGSCPEAQYLESLKTAYERLVNPVINLYKKLKPLQKFIDEIPPYIVGLQITIKGLYLWPPTIGFATSLDKVVDKYKQRILAGLYVIGTLLDTLEKIVEVLEEFKGKLEACGVTIEDSADYRELKQVLINRKIDYKEEYDYRGFRFKVIEQNQGVLIQRYVEIYQQDVVVMKTTPTFASDIEVIFTEAKLKVDRLLS